MCGGTREGAHLPPDHPGLSPRVRGNPSLPAYPAEATGSIPACAGEPRHGRATVPPLRVYPRVCGGTSRSSSLYAFSMGLSPRVRGNQERGDWVHLQIRSIPACAGEPPHEPSILSVIRVYPRVCGGTSRRRAIKRWCTGLSPRVRGNRVEAMYWVRSPRSIPACAGEPRRIRRVR